MLERKAYNYIKFNYLTCFLHENNTSWLTGGKINDN